MHTSYEKMTFYKAPAGRSKKVRRYDHVDLTKEFEMRRNQREQKKQQRLEELYSRHDLQALGVTDLVNFDATKVDRSKLKEEDLKALELQEQAQKNLLMKLKEERQDLVREFD